MPRARARRCALKTTERRPLVRTTARVTGAFSGTKRKRQRRPRRLDQKNSTSARCERREIPAVYGAVAAYGIRRRRPASSDGPAVRSGRRGGSEVGRRRRLPRPSDRVGSFRSRSRGADGRGGGSGGRWAAGRSWGGWGGDGNGRGLLTVVVVGLRRVCLVSWTLRRGVFGRPAATGSVIGSGRKYFFVLRSPLPFSDFMEKFYTFLRK